MKQVGLLVRVDPAGNILVRTQAQKITHPPIRLAYRFRPPRRKFDGDLGSMGAIEVIHALNDLNVKTRHPLEW